MIVVDNSVLVSALTDEGPTGSACAARLAKEYLTAPALIDLEAAHAIRGLLLGNKITRDEADRAMRLVPQMPIQRVQHTELLPRVWELRYNFTAYDAAYVALAERLRVPLVTGDEKLQHGSGACCVIEVIR